MFWCASNRISALFVKHVISCDKLHLCRKMPLMSTAVVVLINITMGVLVFGGAMAILANLGGLLERATSGSWLTLPVSYWPSHVIKALLFSVPTGLIVVRKLVRRL